MQNFSYFLFTFLFCAIRQVSYLAVLFLVLHCCNMYTILKILRKKTQSGLKLRYKLRAIAYRLSNELAVLVRAYVNLFNLLLRVHLYLSGFNSSICSSQVKLCFKKIIIWRLSCPDITSSALLLYLRIRFEVMYSQLFTPNSLGYIAKLGAHDLQMFKKDRATCCLAKSSTRTSRDVTGN